MSITRFLISLAISAASVAAADLAKARAIAEQLQKIQTPDGFGNKLPEQVAPLLAKLKLEVRTWLTRYFETIPATPDPSKLQTSLKAEIKNFLPTTDANRPFGDIDDIRVSKASDKGDVLTVTVSYSSYCQSDDSVLLFERKVGRWRLVLNFDNTDFENPEGSRSLLYAGVSPRDPSGNYYALIVRTRSYCPGSGGIGQMINYHVLRPSENPAIPRVLLSVTRHSRMDDSARFLVEKDSFMMEFPDQSNDYSRIARIHEVKYSVSGNKVVRVQPVAPNARDFVDEWLSRPWSEAAAWSDPKRFEEFRAWHKRIAEPAKGMNEIQQTCTLSGRPVFQVGLEDESRVPVELPFFIVEETAPHIYRLSEIRADSLEHCADPDWNPPSHILPESMKNVR